MNKNAKGLELCILGSNSAAPTAHLFASSQVLSIKNRFILIDCGEGAQMQMRKNKVPFNKVEIILISHAHGDHCFGLPGLLSSFDLLKRTQPLTVYAPKNVIDWVVYLFKYNENTFHYPIYFIEIEQDRVGVLYEDEHIEISTFPLKHSIPCQGFKIAEKHTERKIIAEKLVEYNIPVCDIRGIKLGKDFTDENMQIIPNEELTYPLPKPLSYGYCSDTAFSETILSYIQGVDLLYHEATFDAQNADMASKTGHSTTHQAAQIAHQAGVSYLLIGHYSTRYKSVEFLEIEAREIFLNTYYAAQDTTFVLAEKGAPLEVITSEKSLHL